MTSFENAERVCRIKNPLDWDEEKVALMIAACREMAMFHQANSKEIAHLYKKANFSPESIQSESDIARIPMLGVTAMKYHLLTSLPHEKAVLKLTSSGTRGQKTQIWFDAESLDRVQMQLERLWEQEGLVSETPTNYCNFIYDPRDAKDLGISFSVKNEERFAPANESFFTVRKNTEGKWEFLREATLAKLKWYAEQGRPVRLLGIPSFLFELVSTMTPGEFLKLPPNSYLLTGGGWKAAEDKSVTREAFRKMVTERLGLVDENMRDGYGMAEHSAPYHECKKHRFHIPVYNRVIARDPITLDALPTGQTGLLEFVTPYNAMMPNLAILSTDIGKVDAEACDCGHKSPTFTLLGRGGLVKHKGCAITAGEIVKRN